jgi:hypothetical protein
MSDYAMIQIAQALAPGLIALGVGGIVVGVGLAIRGLAGGSRKRLNEVTERLLDLEDRVRRLSGTTAPRVDHRRADEIPERHPER